MPGGSHSVRMFLPLAGKFISDAASIHENKKAATVADGGFAGKNINRYLTVAVPTVPSLLVNQKKFGAMNCSVEEKSGGKG